MNDYPEYCTIVYRNDQRMIILNDNAEPTPRQRRKLAANNFYAAKDPVVFTPNLTQNTFFRRKKHETHSQKRY